VETRPTTYHIPERNNSEKRSSGFRRFCFTILVCQESRRLLHRLGELNQVLHRAWKPIGGTFIASHNDKAPQIWMSETTTQLDLLSTAHNTIRPTQQRERKKETIDTTHRLPLSSQLITRATLSTRANGGEGREETKQKQKKHHTTQHNNRTQTPYTLQTDGEGTTESQVSWHQNVQLLAIYPIPTRTHRHCQSVLRIINFPAPWLSGSGAPKKAAKCTSTSSGSRSFFLHRRSLPRSVGVESVTHLSLKLPSFHGTLSSPPTQRPGTPLTDLVKKFPLFRFLLHSVWFWGLSGLESVPHSFP